MSVIVTVTDDGAPYLSDCLASLGEQTRKADEVVLAVCGNLRHTAAVAAAEVRRSWRVRVLHRPGRSPEQASREALAGAVGSHVLFLHAGDRLAPDALARLLGAVEDADADLAVAGLVVEGGDPRRAVSLAAVPNAVAGARLGDMLLRRTLARAVAGVHEDVVPWRPAVGALRAAGAPGGIAPVAGAVRAGPTRGTGTPFSGMPRLAPLVTEWAAAVRDARASLHADGLPDAEAALVSWLLAEDAPRFLDDVEHCTADQWRVLRETVTELREAAAPAVWASLAVESRARLWLAEHGDRSAVEEFSAARWRREGQFPTRVVAGTVYAELAAGLPDAVQRLSVDETPLHVRLRRARWTGDALELELLAWVAHVGNQHGDPAVAVALVGGGHRVELPVAAHTGDRQVDVLAGERFQDHAHGAVRVRVTPDTWAAYDVAEWGVEVAWEVAGVRRVATVAATLPGGSTDVLPSRVVAGRTVRLVPGPVALRVTAGGSVAEPAPPRAVELEQLGVDGTHLVLRGRLRGPARLELHGPRGRAAVDVVPADGRFETRLPLWHEPWGLPARPLSSGRYRLVLEGPEPLCAGDGLSAQLPLVLHPGPFRAVVERDGGEVAVVLQPPLRDEEMGPHAQLRLQRAYAAERAAVDPALVYLQSYTGEAATDHPLALHHALRRLRPDLRLRWGVADAATVVPPGGEGVLVGSREWYATLATSAYVVTNIDLEEWFVRRPGQRVLQTYHGYPSKAMGIAAWRAKNLSPLRIERLLRRTSGTWDLLLTPTPEMDVHYREQYLYEGPIHSAGYPRDDVLVSPVAHEVRRRTRKRLGLGDRTAVLYAPTWRDDQATNFRAAPLPATLDVAAAAEQLGEGYVILLRGHRFHRHGLRTGAAVLDVTQYPEINDLVLAADAAVLDYSSLRFDVALTGRPMVFLVPDLERYERGVRGFLYDFRESAPGPMVRTTAEAVAWLRRLGDLSERYAAEYAAFNRRFNHAQDGAAADRVVQTFFRGI